VNAQGDGSPAHAAKLPPQELRKRVGLIEGTVEEFEGPGRIMYEGVLATLPADFSLEGKRILDFGCGAGRVLRHFIGRPEEMELWGCDVHAPSIDWLRENLSPPIHAFANDTLPPLPLDDGSIDLVYALSVFTHLADDWSAWLLEMQRILAPGGLALITTCGEPIWDQHLGKPFFRDELARPWDERSIGMFVTNFGMAQDQVGPCVYHSEWWVRAHWGRCFDILHFQPWGFAEQPGTKDGQGYALMRRRDVHVDAAALEAPGPSAEDELRAVAANLAFVNREMAAWRSLAAAAGRAHEVADARANSLQERVDRLERWRRRVIRYLPGRRGQTAAAG